MRDGKIIKSVSVEDINEQVYRNPDAFVAACEQEYFDQLRQIAGEIHESSTGVVFLAGPSASGKTTTANLLASEIQRGGAHATVISLDNFYRGKGHVPILEDGTEDYESVYALNLEQIERCLEELYETGRSLFPMFDFAKDSPSDLTQEITAGPESVLIVEGIHALNPLISQTKFTGGALKLYVSVNTEFFYRDRLIYSPVTARYVRRLVRDFYFRGQSLERTAQMWRNVCKGEELYIRPFKDNAHRWIDSTLDYEGCVFHHYLADIMRRGCGDYLQQMGQLYDVFDFFDDIDQDKIPENSLLWEFITGNPR